MVIDFSKVNLLEDPILVLKNITGAEIQTLGYAFNIKPELHYNEVSTLSFDLPAYVDGVKTPHYDDVVGMRIIDLVGVGQFILANPTITKDGVKEIKSCKAYSLEYEIARKNISLGTEDTSTYNFYDAFAPKNTILGIIIEKIPSWHIGTVSTSLIGKYRTFDNVSETNVYDFMKSTLQEKYRCIFDFDTYTRAINVLSVDDIVATQPLFFSLDNLLKQVQINEKDDDVVTCLDVSGADGVDIRAVNPTGTNKIYNLDFLIKSGNLSSSFVTKWNNWASNFESQQNTFYAEAVEQSVQSSCALAKDAELLRLSGEMTGLEATKATYVSAIAQGLSKDGDPNYFKTKLTEINSSISAKQTEINTVTSARNAAQAKVDALASEMQAIRDGCAFSAYFTDYVCPVCGGVATKTGDTYTCQSCGAVSSTAESELVVLDRCFKESSVSDETFVEKSVNSYASDDISQTLTGGTIAISGANIVGTIYNDNKRVYTITGGSLSVSGNQTVSAKVVSAAMVWNISDKSAIFTAYLNAGTIGTTVYSRGNLTISGTVPTITDDLTADTQIGGSTFKSGTALSFAPTTSELYFTTDTSDYEEMSVSWDLYQYGMSMLKKLAYPSYTFSVDSGNFLAMEDFNSFRNNLRLGKKVYLDLDGGEVLEPVCIGVSYSYEDLSSLEFEFSSTFSGSDSAMSLVDLLDESISMGSSVASSKNGWSAFVDSGASNTVKSFMDSAIDLSKNKVLSSSGQSVTIDESGIRLRKYTDAARTTYDPNQIWMTEQNIVFTDDNWTTAKMAIGLLQDPTYGSVYGVCAPQIVGTMLAGQNMHITNSGGNFMIDSDGIKISGLKLLISSSEDVTASGSSSDTLSNYVSTTSTSAANTALEKITTTDSNNNIFLDATKLSGAINTAIAKMASCKGNMLYDSTGLWLMDTTDPKTATKAIWENNNGIMIANARSSADSSDPSYSGSTSLTWKTAITADGIRADYIIGDHLHGGFDISAGTASGSDYSSCPFYVSSNGALTAKNADISGTLNASTLELNGVNIMNLFSAAGTSGSDASTLDIGNISVDGSSGIIYVKNAKSGSVCGQIKGTGAVTSADAVEISAVGGLRLLAGGSGAAYIEDGSKSAHIQLSGGAIDLYGTALRYNGNALSSTAVFG